MGAGQGDVTLAANQVLLQFLMIASYALDGFAFSAEALVGKRDRRSDPRTCAPRRDFGERLGHGVGRVDGAGLCCVWRHGSWMR